MERLFLPTSTYPAVLHAMPPPPPLQAYLANFTATFRGVPLQSQNFNWGHSR